MERVGAASGAYGQLQQYWIRLWERDNAPHVVWGREVDDESWIVDATLPDPPQPELWYEYEVDVLAGSRLKFFWNRALIFDYTDPERTFSQDRSGCV